MAVAKMLYQQPEVRSVPYAVGDDRVIGVTGTRVTLETLAAAFGEGASAEETADQ